jgi:hypothetical protein
MAALNSFPGYFLPGWVNSPKLSKFLLVSGAFFRVIRSVQELCEYEQFKLKYQLVKQSKLIPPHRVIPAPLPPSRLFPGQFFRKVESKQVVGILFGKHEDKNSGTKAHR